VNLTIAGDVNKVTKAIRAGMAYDRMSALHGLKSSAFLGNEGLPHFHMYTWTKMSFAITNQATGALSP
jgi:hypothetical protein